MKISVKLDLEFGLKFEISDRKHLVTILGRTCYAAPIGAFFCPEIRAFTGFWGEISSTASKVLSDRKVLFKHKMAVNSR